MMEQLADKRVRRDRQAAQAFDDEQSGAEDRSDDGEYECVPASPLQPVGRLS